MSEGALDQHRRILKDQATFDRVRQFADSKSWTLLEHVEVPESSSFYATWAIDQENQLQYIDDGVRGFRYVMVSGPSAASHVAAVERGVEHIPLDGIMSIWETARAPEHFIIVLPMLGVAAPPAWESQVALAIEQGLLHMDERVRFAAVWAAAATAWPEWADTLAWSANHDSSPEVQQAASEVLRGFGHQAPGD